MARNIEHTHLLISLITNIKDDEIEQSKAKMEKLSALVQNHPHNKLCQMRYQMACRRLEHLIITSNKLKNLKSDFF